MRRLDRRRWRAPPSTARRRTAARGLCWSTSSDRPRWRRRRARRSEGRGQVEEGSGVACVHAVRGVPALRRSPLAPSGSCGKPEPTRTCGGDVPVERDQRCPSDGGPRHVSGPACRGARRTWRERGGGGCKGCGIKKVPHGQAGDRYRSRTSEGAGPGIKRVPAGPLRGPLSIPRRETRRLTRPRRDSRPRDELQRLGAPRSRVLRLRVVGSGDGGEHDLVHPVGRREGADLRGDGLPGADEPP